MKICPKVSNQNQHLKMKVFNINLIAFLIIYCNSQSVHGLYFPHTTPINWDPVDDQNLICPTLKEEPSPLDSYEGPFNVVKPTLKHQVSVEGYLCHKANWITTCNKGFFGSEIYTNTISSEYIIDTECISAVNIYLNTGTVQKGFPPARCFWMTTSSEKNTEITVTPRSVIIDPITGAYLDSVFVGGICNESPRETIHQELLWITKKNKTAICMDEDHHSIQIHVKLNTVDSKITDFDIWSDDLTATSTVGACISSYCSLRGITLGTGEWIAFSPETDATRVVTLHLERCKANLGEKVLSTQGKIDLATRNIYKKLRQIQCEKVKSNILTGDSITRSDLQLFTPTGPGRHPVYRYNNGQIEVSVADYLHVNMFTFMNRSTLAIGLTKSNLTMYWNGWLQTTSRIRDGPNGLYVYDLRIIHPDLTRTSQVANP